MNDISNIDFHSSKFIDVFFSRNVPEAIPSFFHGGKPVEEAYEDKTFSYTEYTPAGTVERKMIIPGKDILKIRIQSRYRYVDRFADNKHADIELIGRLVCSRREVVCLNSQFHVGSLSDDYAQSRTDTFGGNDYHYYHLTVPAMDRIAREAQNGTVLRIWYAHNTQDLCGLMSLLHKLKDIDCTILELELPDEVYLPSGRKRKNCRNWGDFSAEELCIPISGARILTKEKKSYLLMRWQKLVHENSEYRICENGEIKSASFEDLRKKAIPHLYKNKFSLWQLVNRLSAKENAFKNLSIIGIFPHFVHRLIDAGDIEFLGRRISGYSEDCWLKSLHKTTF